MNLCPRRARSVTVSYQADRARVGSRATRCRPKDEARDRRALPQPHDRGDPPAQHIPQAQHRLTRRTRARRRARRPFGEHHHALARPGFGSERRPVLVSRSSFRTGASTTSRRAADSDRLRLVDDIAPTARGRAGCRSPNAPADECAGVRRCFRRVSFSVQQMSVRCITATITSTCARTCESSSSAVTQRLPSRVSRRPREQGQPSCASSACSRCAQPVRSPASV